ncbi:LuxR C-terminal-related transcriptional regulator [Microvirga splendida]|uniref:Response regulator transcription factor n=1 Tax=Microvirga splendida TaxID=2795727 RepID=A0ABS0XZ36_9HYPH|nr:response regulator transcription factor [Microvirga splendida]MBJ6125324.1 response regulator transcription factor [Microvirga splendida]
MGHNVVYKEQILPIAHDPFQNVTTVLICQNILLRTGISHILAGTRFDIAGETGDLSPLSTFPEGVPVLFLICDGRSPCEYVQTVKELKEQHPHSRVVVLADTMDPQDIVQICKEGLDGFCTTRMDRHAIIKALELVMLGETFIPGSVGLDLLDQIRSSHAGGVVSRMGSLSPANDPALLMNKLSEREAQILRCLTQGASNKLIARELGVAEATVKVHIKAILRKVKAVNRTQAAMWAAGHFGSTQESAALVPGE